MILIASAAYVNAEFQIEFGRLPPALLPVGNRRLVEHQVDALQRQFPDEQIVLSLPESYTLPAKDEVYLARRKVRVVRNDDRLTLAASIEAAIDKSDPANDHGGGTLRLLHGDTWMPAFPADADLIGLVRTHTDYAWEVEQPAPAAGSAESVWCGWFAFSDVPALRAALRSSEGRFTRAVRQYDLGRAMARRTVVDWHDFGHVNTYFLSRTSMTTERSFNALTIADGCVRKTGTPAAKIEAERAWFAALPPGLRVFAPQLLDHGAGPDGAPFYELEYLPLPPLNELFVHGRNPVAWWDKVFRLCADFMARCGDSALSAVECRAVEADFVALSGRKTWQRLDVFIQESGHPGLDVPASINGVEVPPLRAIVEDCLERLAVGVPVPGIVHGDLCLSNILFDSRTDRIKVIDPRGLDADGRPCVTGDLRYDLAKLTHSVLGLYDHIVAGAFDLDRQVSRQGCVFQLRIHVDDRARTIQKLFERQRFVGGLRAADVLPLTVLLFLAMLPLHADRPARQWALLANALRLYALHMPALVTP